MTDTITCIHEILTKPDVSDSARLNAAKYIVEKASTPPSRPGEFHPEPLTEPDVSLSTYPARATR